MKISSINTIYKPISFKQAPEGANNPAQPVPATVAMDVTQFKSAAKVGSMQDVAQPFGTKVRKFLGNFFTNDPLEQIIDYDTIPVEELATLRANLI